jgi:hypothetical protein
MRRLVYLLVLLGGCATYPQIDYSVAPPADWPRLREESIYGTVEEVTEKCKSFSERGGKMAGCAMVYLEQGVCVMYLSSRDPELLAHERAHCRGFAHVGDGDKVHKDFGAWKARKK